MRLSRCRLLAAFGLFCLVGGPLSARQMRIVDYGADMGSGYYRGTSSTASSTAVDVDGDGQTSDDSLAYWRFSLTDPMNPQGVLYDVEATNAQFFGGITAFFNASGKSLTEGMLNENHERRDDWNLMVALSTIPPVRVSGFWFWRKEDFLNGGHQYPVRFDADSMIAPHISRYFNGVEDGRWVARNGAQFYISEKRFTQYQAEIGRTSPLHTSYILHPTTTRWAPYNPSEPYAIRFDAASATWENRSFDDVTGVGFYVYRDTLGAVDIGLKWHSFETYAVVDRPETPSYYADMVTVSAGTMGGQPIPAMSMGRTEVPYRLWKRVWKWAVSSQYCFDLNPGFTFNKDGDMGSMDAGTTSHGPDEPVTDLSWHDAVLFCNALSELEGLRPVYYADTAKTQVLRTIQGRYFPDDYDDEFAVYADWTADGFRLPTPAEWGYAAAIGGFDTGDSAGWTGANSGGRTHAVAGKSPNGAGLYDMAGNVWEFVWDVGGDVFQPATQTSHAVVGGDFRYPADPATASFLPWGDDPFNGTPTIGLRIMRSTGQAPPMGLAPSGVPSWTFAKSQVIPPAAPPPAIRPPVIGDQLIYVSGTDTYGISGDPAYENDNIGFSRIDEAFVTVTPFYMGRTEVTYAQWNKVFQWAIRNGYRLDWDGDMGSMDWDTDSGRTHGPDEPVIQIGWNDAVVWCNAASEYEGLDPVYYSDSGRTQILKEANRWRIAMDMRPGYQSATNQSLQLMNVYPRWEKNGYRLPTGAEWEAAYRDRNKSASATYPWTGGVASGTNYSWVKANSGNTTHPVAGRTANGYGLYDLAGNATEWCWDWPGTEYYKAHNPKGSDTQSTLFGKMLRGGNFGWDAFAISTMEQERESAPRAYFGFRVARCNAGEHPENTQFVPPVVVDLDAADFRLNQDAMFRYNNHRTGCTDRTGVPSGPVRARWTFATGSPVLASPVAVGGKVYIGSDNGKFYCIDGSSGVELWRFAAGKPIRSSAAVVDGKVFFHGGERLYCLDATTGSHVWSYTRGSVTQINVAPAVAHGIVYGAFGIYTGASYSGIRISDGVEVWRFRLGTPNLGPMGPALDGLTFYAPYSDNMVMASDLETEYFVWNRAGHHSQTCMVIVNADRLLYLQRGDLKAINRATGTTAWTANLGGAFDDRPESSPAVGPVILGGTSQEVRAFAGIMDGGLHCRDAASGAARWSVNLGGKIKSSPTLCRNVIYIGAADGRLLALDAVGGSTTWSFQTGAEITASPWVTDGIVYIADTDGNVIAVEAIQSYETWSGSVFSNSPGAPSGPADDPDNDGQPNLLEYALDAAPLTPDAAVVAPVVGPAGASFVFRFRRDTTKTDLRYIVRASPDLLQWPDTWFDSDATPVPNNAGTYHQVSGPAFGGKLFLRLEVEKKLP